MSNFWSDAATEPKRKFRYLLYFAGMPQFMAKSVTKPSFQVASTAHSFLQHNFNFPGRVTWQDVTITLVDPIQPDATASLYSILKGAGYVLPDDVGDQGSDLDTSTISKSKMIESLGSTVRIDTIGPGGAADIYESWILNNPQITSVTFDTLDYSSDEILNVTVGLKYDWATLNEEGIGLVNGYGQPWTSANTDNQ